MDADLMNQSHPSIEDEDSDRKSSEEESEDEESQVEEGSESVSSSTSSLVDLLLSTTYNTTTYNNNTNNNYNDKIDSPNDNNFNKNSITDIDDDLTTARLNTSIKTPGLKKYHSSYIPSPSTSSLFSPDDVLSEDSEPSTPIHNLINDMTPTGRRKLNLSEQLELTPSSSSSSSSTPNLSNSQLSPGFQKVLKAFVATKQQLSDDHSFDISPSSKTAPIQWSAMKPTRVKSSTTPSSSPDISSSSSLLSSRFKNIKHSRNSSFGGSPSKLGLDETSPVRALSSDDDNDDNDDDDDNDDNYVNSQTKNRIIIGNVINGSPSGGHGSAPPTKRKASRKSLKHNKVRRRRWSVSSSAPTTHFDRQSTSALLALARNTSIHSSGAGTSNTDSNHGSRAPPPSIFLAKIQYIFRKQKLLKVFSAWRTYTAKAKMNALEAQNEAFRREREKAVEEEKRAVSTKIKKRHIESAFYNLTSLVVTFGLLCLLYYNYLMISPYMTPLFWALLISILLSKPYNLALITVQSCDLWLQPYKGRFLLITSCIYSICFILTTGPAFWLYTGTFVMILFLISMDRHSLVAIMALTAVILGVALPMAFFIRVGFEESQAGVLQLTAFIENNEEIQRLFDDYESSATYQKIVEIANSWGYDMSFVQWSSIRAQLIELIKWAGNNVHILFGSALNVLSDLSHLLFSVVLFLTALYYFLTYKELIVEKLETLSPFSAEDNTILLGSLYTSITSIFFSLISIGTLHAAVTFISFWLASIEFPFTFAVLSGFLSMLPVLSSWIIWAPACLILYATERTKESLIVAGFHLVAMNFDSFVYSKIPGGNSYVIGMSIATGLYTFGLANGALIGPLVSGLSVTIYDIYVKYQEEALDRAFSKKPTSTPATSASSSSTTSPQLHYQQGQLGQPAPLSITTPSPVLGVPTYLQKGDKYQSKEATVTTFFKLSNEDHPSNRPLSPMPSQKTRL